MHNKKCIAIDGPAGAGKSTVAKLVAQRLGLLYIDTGAMYRAITLKALRRGVKEDPGALSLLAKDTRIQLVPGIKQQVMMDGEDVTEEVRKPEVCCNVSLVAQVPGVREVLVEQQRLMAKENGVVMDGRDIGTVVLPKATHKFFLTASPEERALRRAKELSQKGYTIDIKTLTDEIRERDYIDSNREIAPLVPAEDALIIDSTGMEISQVVDMIIEIINKE